MAMKKRQQQATERKKEILTKEKEDSWRISPSTGIPSYNAENDPHCPTGQIRKFNEEKKLKAKILGQRDKVTEKFIKSNLEPSIEDISLPVKQNFRAKVTKDVNKAKTRETYNEIEILQKIVVRENLLSELTRLLQSQNDVSSCLSEVVELVKAVRYQTLDIIDDISSWLDLQPSPQGFQFKGFNYLVKIRSDLDFLDSYDEIVEKFCFEFKSNPLAYRGGGNVIAGFDFDRKKYNEDLMHSYYTSEDDEFLDGLDVARLHNAEKVIQNEFIRLAKEKNANNVMKDQNDMNQILDRDIFNALNTSVTSLENDDGELEDELQQQHQQQATAGNNKSAKTTTKTRKKGGKSNTRRGGSSGTGVTPAAAAHFNPKKVKQERILALTEEANELKAMIAHVGDKINVLDDHHHELVTKRKALDARLQEAKSMGREIAGQHIMAEISVTTTLIQENTAKVKDLQRETYFIELERKRKVGTIQKLKDEIVQEKRRIALQKKITAKIKKEGLLAALDSFNMTSGVSADQIANLSQKTTIASVKRKDGAQESPLRRDQEPMGSGGTGASDAQLVDGDDEEEEEEEEEENDNDGDYEDEDEDEDGPTADVNANRRMMGSVSEPLLRNEDRTIGAKYDGQEAVEEEDKQGFVEEDEEEREEKEGDMDDQSRHFEQEIEGLSADTTADSLGGDQGDEEQGIRKEDSLAAAENSTSSLHRVTFADDGNEEMNDADAAQSSLVRGDGLSSEGDNKMKQNDEGSLKKASNINHRNMNDYHKSGMSRSAYNAKLDDDESVIIDGLLGVEEHEQELRERDVLHGKSSSFVSVQSDLTGTGSNLSPLVGGDSFLEESGLEQENNAEAATVEGGGGGGGGGVEEEGDEEVYVVETSMKSSPPHRQESPPNQHHGEDAPFDSSRHEQGEESSQQLQLTPQKPNSRLPPSSPSPSAGRGGTGGARPVEAGGGAGGGGGGGEAAPGSTMMLSPDMENHSTGSAASPLGFSYNSTEFQREKDAAEAETQIAASKERREEKTAGNTSTGSEGAKRRNGDDGGGGDQQEDNMYISDDESHLDAVDAADRSTRALEPTVATTATPATPATERESTVGVATPVTVSPLSMQSPAANSSPFGEDVEGTANSATPASTATAGGGGGGGGRELFPPSREGEVSRSSSGNGLPMQRQVQEEDEDAADAVVDYAGVEAGALPAGAAFQVVKSRKQ